MIFSIFYVVVFAHADFYMHINVSLMYACGFHGNDSSLFFFKQPPTYGASLVARIVKNLPVMQETWVRSLGQKDSLEKEMAPTPVVLPCHTTE